MAKTSKPSLRDEGEDAIISMKAKQLELSLPREEWFMNEVSPYIYWYQNFWCPSGSLHSLLSLQAHFRARDSDILLATKPKSGTTCLKALAFAILNRSNHPAGLGSHPLLSTNPHGLMPHLEYLLPHTHPLDLSKLDPPRLLSTHLPYHALAESIRTSGCRIVYLCRNPFDTIVSLVKFKEVMEQEMDHESFELEKMVDSVCRGVEWYGPHWDHVLGYWNMSLEKPDKVLFMKYEDLKMDEISELKRLAEFLRAPFSEEEEESGVIDEISKLCSLRHLKGLEVKQSRRFRETIEKKSFFRKGEVGEWKNHMSPALYERLEMVMQDKFRGTGLTFKTSN